MVEPRITKTPGVCGGKACIAGHRIRVQDIFVWHELQGMSAGEIVLQFPTVTMSDVYYALAYYFDHVEEIREEMRKETEFAEEFRRNHPSLLQEKLREAGLERAS